MDANTEHPAVGYGKLGVLLVNLGTPDGTDVTSMRRYLREFLSDRRVIEWSRLFWYPILYGIVLNTRPRKVGKAYELIWNKDLNESWLRTYTRNQAALMAEAFGGQPQVVVDWAMRYGQPSIASRIEALQKAGCERILVFPLYPQYAAATTATVNDKAFEALLKMRWQPALRTVPPYHDDPVYIDALATSINKHLATLDWEPELVLASFHGIPKSYFEKATPIIANARRLRGCSAKTRLAAGQTSSHLPVALRPGRVAAALYGRHRGKTGQGRREADRRHQSGLRFRLSGDARRDRRPGRRELPP